MLSDTLGGTLQCFLDRWHSSCSLVAHTTVGMLQKKLTLCSNNVTVDLISPKIHIDITTKCRAMTTILP